MKSPQSKVFKNAFLFSLLLHSMILLPMPSINQKASVDKDEELLLKYLILNNPPAEKKIAPLSQQNIRQYKQKKQRSAQSAEQRAPEKTIAKKPLQQRQVEKEPSIPERSSEPKCEKKTVTAEKVVAENKENDLKKDKTYLSYYKLINRQLQESVIYPSNFTDGEVEVSFVLNADGSLRGLEVIDQTSESSYSLRETALQIVRNASPFPPFPESLQKQQLTFNVVICFRSNS